MIWGGQRALAIRTRFARLGAERPLTARGVLARDALATLTGALPDDLVVEAFASVVLVVAF